MCFSKVSLVGPSSPQVHSEALCNHHICALHQCPELGVTASIYRGRSYGPVGLAPGLAFALHCPDSAVGPIRVGCGP